MKNVLMMGGPKDGVRIQVQPRSFEITVAMIGDVPFTGELCDASTNEQITHTIYFIHEFETDMGTLYLATQERHHQAHDLMAMLVNGYRSGGDAE